MASAASQRHSSRELLAFASPELHVSIGPHYPGAVVGMDVNRAIESVRPIDHHGVKVRVRNRNRAKSSECLNEFREAIVQQRNAVPEHVTVTPAHQQRTLSDSDLRVNSDADDTLALCVDRVSVPPLKPGVRCPLLPVRVHELAFVGADGAVFRRLIALRVLRTALCANVTLHACP